MKVLIISGRSGSGKSVVLQTLEDLHYYCVDNIPSTLLPTLLEQLKSKQVNIAVSVDVRNINQSNSDLEAIIKKIKEIYASRIIYIDADDAVLIKRFKETRRRHPLTNQNISLVEAIQKEHELLAPLLEQVDLKIDTTHLTPQQLRQRILDYIEREEGSSLSILLESFGYKYGIPDEADFIFDVRCLPNPYWDTQLRNKTGLEPDVIRYLESQPACQALIEDIYQFLIKWIPSYQAEQRKYLTIAIGCTGGIHRSVYIAAKLEQKLRAAYENMAIRHREIS